VPDLRACYAILEADTSGYTVTLHRVDYDHAAVIEKLHEARYPDADYIISFLEGKYIYPKNG
jgi:hypothetical protein